MLQLAESAVRLGAPELSISSLRPTIYRPSRPTPRIPATDPRDGDSTRRTVTPERNTGIVKPS